MPFHARLVRKTEDGRLEIKDARGLPEIVKLYEEKRDGDKFWFWAWNKERPDLAEYFFSKSVSLR